MTLSRNIHLGHVGLLSGKWNRSSLVGSELRGKILGVVGLGRIGREVTKRAIGLEMNIIGYDPFVSQDIFDEETVKIVELDELTEKSDYITLHVPLIDSTRNLFDAKRLSKMKSSARIINVARGGIINESDLANSLNKSIIAGAAIDVFENEHLEANHPLITAKNALITPHLGASTHEASEGVSTGICKQIRDFFVEEKLSNPLNMPINDMAELRKIAPLLDLSKILGMVASQLIDTAVKSISIECFGNIVDSKAISLSYLIGLLQRITDTRLNFVNAAVIAEERGITFSHSLNTESISFANMICASITTQNSTMVLSGSVFGTNHFRIVNVLGYSLDFKPEGNMLFVQNKDIPGVIGKVGSLLSDAKVNIGEFLLGRSDEGDMAYSVIKIDDHLQSDLLAQLIQMDEILSAKQVVI